MKNISIKWKIFLYLIGFCGVLLVMLWLFQVVFLGKFYKDIRTNDVKAAAKTVMENIESKELGAILLDLNRSREIFVTITDENNKTIFGDDANRKIESKQELIKERRPPESISFTQEVTLSSGKKITINSNAIITPVNATVTTLRIQLYYITGFMLLFSIILALVIAKRVSKPIEKINESAKILATGNYQTVFHGNGYKEINELSDTLNFTAKELAKVEGLRQELIANISHDLRTPLTLISGYAEAMRDLPEENNMENAQIILDATKRLTTLVNDVLDISKLQAGEQNINYATYNLTQSLQETISRMRELVKKDGYSLNFVYEEEVMIVADEKKLAQAFYNLLTNAINYTGADKTVIIKQLVVEDKVRIEVIDSGEGISAENLQNIWNRYYKVDQVHKRAVVGTGLGLSIVKSIIELHEGEFGVLSKINEGSVFWFSLKK
ncbi:MAG: HAMP domain-containing sensor histidine kinase [Clostridia bacterium]